VKGALKGSFHCFTPAPQAGIYAEWHDMGFLVNEVNNLITSLKKKRFLGKEVVFLQKHRSVLLQTPKRFIPNVEAFSFKHRNVSGKPLLVNFG